VAPAESVLAQLAAARGDDAAVERSERAVALGEETDMLWMQGELWDSHARVLSHLGRLDDARQALLEAAERFERKGATRPALDLSL
jgi:hypothetical protein